MRMCGPRPSTPTSVEIRCFGRSCVRLVQGSARWLFGMCPTPQRVIGWILSQFATSTNVGYTLVDYAEWGLTPAKEGVVAYLQSLGVRSRANKKRQRSLTSAIAVFETSKKQRSSLKNMKEEKAREDGLDRPITSGFGHNMLCGMGWVPGTPLKEGGLAQPLACRPRKGKEGLRSECWRE